MLIVKKFGGSSVADTERILRAAQIIADARKEGNGLVIVLSAQGDTTDELLEKAAKLSDAPSLRELDMLLATGEQQSVALMSIALINMGVPAVSLNAVQAGIKTVAEHSNARISDIQTDRISSELEDGKVVIVTGFQGIDEDGDIATLGRGGSDTSAVALAVALDADLCEIYTDVDGVYTSDPRIVPNAKKLDEISYSEMLEMATLGARVLHNRSVELSMLYNVKLCVRSSFTKEEGTRIVRKPGEGYKKYKAGVDIMEKRSIAGVAGDLDVCRISVIGIEKRHGSAYRLFSMLAENKINVDIIVQSTDKDGLTNVTFSAAKSDADRAKKLISENLEKLGAKAVEAELGLAKISVVGAGMASDCGVAARMFEVMHENDIDVLLVTTSEIKISVLISAENYVKAMNVVHNKFRLGE